MKENWKQKWFQRDNLLILILSGVLLLIIALPTKSSDGGVKGTEVTGENLAGTESAQRKADSGTASKNLTGSEWLQDLGTQSGEDYAGYLEEKLSAVLEGMQGVGKTTVMVTLKSSEELVVEKDQPVNHSNTTESDAQGGSRSIVQTESQETTIYRTEGTASEPYVVKTLLPRVEGVVVVAEGAGSGEISKNITESVQALFGIEVHKIKVVKMRNGG